MSLFSSSQPKDPALAADASRAAHGDQDAFDRLFGNTGGNAWGVAFITAESVGAATDAVVEGFTEILATADNGMAIDDVRLELLRATRLAAVRQTTDGSDDSRHAREPVSLLGETKDRQATLALTALSETTRVALWLVDVERLTLEQVSSILGIPFQEAEELVRSARTSFRRYYVDAVKREGLTIDCITTLDKLAPYIDQALQAGDTAAVEAHLGTCDACRGVVTKLNDLESRLRAGIPPVPAWVRQTVVDTWTAMAPARAGGVAADADAAGNRRTPFLAGTAAVFVVVAGITTAVLLASSDTPTETAGETSSSQLAAPPRKANIAQLIDPEFTVGTPDLEAAPPTTAPPVTAPTTTAVTSPPATSPPVTATTKTTVVKPVTTTTTEPPTTTTTDEPDQLIDLPAGNVTTASSSEDES